MSDYGYDDPRPDNYRYVDALPIAQIAEKQDVEADYRWLEKYLPYDAGAESSVHWFVRFK